MGSSYKELTKKGYIVVHKGNEERQYQYLFFSIVTVIFYYVGIILLRGVLEKVFMFFSKRIKGWRVTYSRANYQTDPFKDAF